MNHHVWPLHLAAREGFETAKAGRWTSLLMIIAIAWACAAPGAADAIGVSRLVEDEHAWVEAGGHVFVVEGARSDGIPNPISAGVCERLSLIDGIDASFALVRTNASGSLSHIPGGRPGLYDVTPGVFRFLGAEPTTEGTVLATKGFERRTGVQTGDPVWVTRRAGFGVAPGTSDLLRVAVVDASVMGEEFDGALLLPSLIPQTANACYVRTDAAHHTAVEAALPGLLAYDGKPAIPNPRLFSGEFTIDYTHAFEDRPLRWVWVASAGALGLLWGMIQWFRRSQVAIYATFGARPRARLMMQATEWGALAVIGGLWGWSLGILLAISQGARAAQALSVVTFHTGLTLLGASVMVVILGLRPTGTLLNALKDR
jgi:hypothetical protein